MLRYTTRPLSDRTWLRPSSKRTTSRFDSTWTSTLDLLERELGLLHASEVVLEVDVTERYIRNDGMLRADARAVEPAVVLAFETKAHGSMLYRCDRYVSQWASQGPSWQQNVRAIALTLEALRAVDRYGATETGQQYTGFKALPAGRAMPASHMTRDAAVDLLDQYTDHDWDATDPSDVATVLRRARAKTHPDAPNGDRALWDQVEQAARVLGVVS